MLRTGKFWTGVVAFAALVGVGCGDDVTVELVASTIDFGETDCGTTAIPRVMTVTNNSDEAFHFATELAAGADSRYTLVPPTGVVLPHSQATVMIFSKPIPAESAVTPNLYGETLTLTTDREDDKPHEVAITQTAHGAVIEVSSTALNFATEVKLGTSSELPFMIRNAGNAPASVSVEGETPSVTFVASSSTIAAGDALQGAIKFSPGHNTAHSEEVSIRTQGPTCGTSKVVVSGLGSAHGIAAHALPANVRLRPKSASTICIRTTTGVVACAGANDGGMRGAPDEYLNKHLPIFQGKGGNGGVTGGFELLDRVNVVQTETGFLTDVVELSGGLGFYCARRQAGDVWCWGNYRGLINQFPGPERNNPVAVKIIDADAVGLAGGYRYRCQIVGGNRAFTCTTNRSSTNTVNPNTWALTGVTNAAVNGGGGYAVLTDGTVMSFGLNESGERGNADNEFDPPSPVTGLTGITQVVAGGRNVNRNGRFGCARKDDGTVWCWGDNNHGQLGNGTNDQRSHQGRQTPVQVIDGVDTPLAGVTAVTAGRSHACALIGGAVSCWGRPLGAISGSGGLGDPRAKPTDPPLTNAVSIEGGGTHATCAALSTGALHCWGSFGNSIYTGPEPMPAFDP